MTEDVSMYNKARVTNPSGIVKSFSFPDGDIRGDTFYIKHLSENFTVIDCYLKDGDDRSSRKKAIIDEIRCESKGRVTRFISTHPDNDHILGIEALDEVWPIKNFYSVDNQIPIDKSDSSLVRYAALKALQEMPIEKGIKRACLNEDSNCVGCSGLSFVWPVVDNEKYKTVLEKVANPGKDQVPKPNNISCGIRYSVRGGASYLWLGDMETDMQQEFYSVCKDEIYPVDVFFHPHHGRKKSSKPPSELLVALDPQIIVIGNAPTEHLNRENPEKTITQNTAGDILFHNDTDMNMVHVFTGNNADNMPKCLKKVLNVVFGFGGLRYQGSFSPRK